jgi:hypothetical protein
MTGSHEVRGSIPLGSTNTVKKGHPYRMPFIFCALCWRMVATRCYWVLPVFLLHLSAFFRTLSLREIISLRSPLALAASCRSIAPASLKIGLFRKLSSSLLRVASAGCNASFLGALTFCILLFRWQRQIDAQSRGALLNLGNVFDD